MLEKWIKKYKRGDVNALLPILEYYEPLIKRKMKLAETREELEDRFADLRLLFIQAVNEHKTAKSIEKEFKKKTRAYYIGLKSQQMFDPTQKQSEWFELSEDLSELLPKRLRQIYKRYYKDRLTQEEIAEILGKSQQYISLEIIRIRGILKKKLTREIAI